MRTENSTEQEHMVVGLVLSSLELVPTEMQLWTHINPCESVIPITNFLRL